MDHNKLGKQISTARLKKGITQADLAEKCKLNIRTIQRIESGTVLPRSYTIKLINEVLGISIDLNVNNHLADMELGTYRKTFKSRKTTSIAIAFSALFILIVVIIISFPSWELFGLHKRAWAPFLYLVLFGHLLGIGLVWKCPGCNKILGDLFKTKYCSRCGLKFYD